MQCISILYIKIVQTSNSKVVVSIYKNIFVPLSLKTRVLTQVYIKRRKLNYKEDHKKVMVVTSYFKEQAYN